MKFVIPQNRDKIIKTPKYVPPKRFTEDYEEYRDAIRINNRIWSKFYNLFYSRGLSRNEAAEKARENVARFRARYPFPAFIVGVNHEKSEQDESTGGLVLGGVPEKGTNPEQILTARLQNASAPMQVHSGDDETGHAPCPEYTRTNEVLGHIGEIPEQCLFGS